MPDFRRSEASLMGVQSQLVHSTTLHVPTWTPIPLGSLVILRITVVSSPSTHRQEYAKNNTELATFYVLHNDSGKKEVVGADHVFRFLFTYIYPLYPNI